MTQYHIQIKFDFNQEISFFKPTPNSMWLLSENLNSDYYFRRNNSFYEFWTADTWPWHEVINEAKMQINLLK